MTSIAELWEAVQVDRDDLAPRMVLGDALLEAGSSRGELIHLQCDGHPTLRATLADEPTSVYTSDDNRAVELAMRGHELAAASWHAWLPELEPILEIDRCWFHEGMLHGIVPSGTAQEWHELAGHPELAMVRKVRCSDRSYGVLYGAAIDALPYAPDWIDLDEAAHVNDLLALRSTWAIRGLRLRNVWPSDIGPAFPDVTHVEIKPGDSRSFESDVPISRFEAAHIVRQIDEARAAFPKLTSIAFTSSWLQLRLTAVDRELVRELRSRGIAP
jgi:hypothetical protein